MKRVVIIFGSKSSEHEVSCVSAGNILENIDRNKFDVYMIGIDKQGEWFKYTGDVHNVTQNKWLEDINNKEKIQDILGELKKYDLAFPVLHGKYGEDGTIQGLFEMAGIKYTGCKVLASSICMDKQYAKMIASSVGIKVVDYVVVEDNEDCKIENIHILFDYPVIIKPAREGSSYGIFKVSSKDSLMKAIKETFKYDSKILIEKYIEKRVELECAVMGNGNNIEVAGPCQIVTEDGFYDYQTKYVSDVANINIKANIPNDVKEYIQTTAKKIYKLLSLSGLSRIDFFLDKEDNTIYFNEVNTMPGFTQISMFPKMFIEEGMEYKDIITKIIEYGLE